MRAFLLAILLALLAFGPGGLSHRHHHRRDRVREGAHPRRSVTPPGNIQSPAGEKGVPGDTLRPASVRQSDEGIP